MHIELASSLEEVATAIAAADNFCDSAELTKAARQAVELALDELLTNIVSYAYPDLEPHRISVDLSIEGAVMQIVISDDGMAFNPLDRDAPDRTSSIDERKPGGVGIHLVKDFMDDYSYQRLGECNVLTLRKNLDRA